MDIFELALKMEKDGEDAYLKLSKESQSIGLRKIFKMLAEEESKHHKNIIQMQKESTFESPSVKGLKPQNVFENLVEEESNFSVTQSEIALYHRCLECEVKSRDFYRDAIKKADSDSAINLLELLVKEEEKHITLLENIIEFVTFDSNHVEHAEFTHEDAS